MLIIVKCLLITQGRFAAELHAAAGAGAQVRVVFGQRVVQVPHIQGVAEQKDRPLSLLASQV